MVSISKDDFAVASQVLKQRQIDRRDYLYIRTWELPMFVEWYIRGNHPYHYGVSYVYKPKPFVFS